MLIAAMVWFPPNNDPSQNAIVWRISMRDETIFPIEIVQFDLLPNRYYNTSLLPRLPDTHHQPRIASMVYYSVMPAMSSPVPPHPQHDATVLLPHLVSRIVRVDEAIATHWQFPWQPMLCPICSRIGISPSFPRLVCDDACFRDVEISNRLDQRDNRSCLVR